MATDRMYLECPCGSAFRLARYSSPPWQASDDTGPKLNEWFEEHQHCDPVMYPTEPALVYESDGPPSQQVATYMARVRAGEIEMGKAPK